MMKQLLGKIFLFALGGALLAYSASRSLDFISMTLPEDKKILAWFGLLALDGGLIIWLLSFMYGSSGASQRVTCFIMIGVDFIGSVVMFSADTLYRTGAMGLTAALDQNAIQAIVIVLSCIIALNIGAGVVHTLTDPALLEASAKEDANAKVLAKARSLLSERSDVMAAELAPQLAAASMDEIRSEHLNWIDDKKKATASRRKTSNTPELPLSPTLPNHQEVLPTTSPLLTPKSGRN